MNQHHRSIRLFKRRVERVVPGCWGGFLKALRASRSREVRRMDNGRFLESQIVGHSEEVADKHYDAVKSRTLNKFGTTRVGSTWREKQHDGTDDSSWTCLDASQLVASSNTAGL